MGKLMNIVPRNLFRKKMENIEEITVEKKPVILKDHSAAQSYAYDNTEDHTLPDAKKDLPIKQNDCMHNAFRESKHILDRFPNENLEAKLYHAERSFLFEQNNTAEKFELEKRDMLDNFKKDKLRMKRSYENEKTELMKEIEGRDKMLFEISKVLKEEHEKRLGEQREEILTSLEEKLDLFKLIEPKMKLIIDNLHKVVENNERAFENFREFEQLQKEYETFSTMKIRNYSDEVERRSSNESRKNDIEDSNNKRNSIAKSDIFDETSIQHELAQAYRKQKSELLKLFNSEKEEHGKKLSQEKHRFEKEVRLEYETRMSVERKAWQETIEDYEREISILKFEREQMDRNYCIGMDELKTEFEREKRVLHRQYSENAEIKKSLKAEF